MGDGRWRTLFVTIIIRWLTNLRCPNTWDLTKASLLMKRSFCTSCITASWLQVCFYIPYRIKFPSRHSSVQLLWYWCATKSLKCATRLPSLCNYTMPCMRKVQSVFKKVQLGVHFLQLSSVPTHVLLLCSWMCAFVQLKKDILFCFCIMQDVWCI